MDGIIWRFARSLELYLQLLILSCKETTERVKKMKNKIKKKKIMLLKFNTKNHRLNA